MKKLFIAAVSVLVSLYGYSQCTGFDLQVSVSGNDPEIISLSWTDMQSDGYKIYRKLNADNDWQLIATLEGDALQYEQNKPSACSIKYKVTANIYGEECESEPQEINKNDFDPPSKPEIHPVSVDLSSQKVVVSWQSCPEQDTWGYVICKDNQTGQPVVIDTVYGKNNTSYTCQTCAVNEVNNIAVYAFDSCSNSSLRTDLFSNIVLTSFRSNCSEPLQLSWNHLKKDNIQNPVYNIYMSENSSEYTLIGSTDGLTYTVDLPSTNGVTKIYIAGMSSESTYEGLSNVLTFSAENSDTLDFMYLRSASVKEDNLNIELTAFVDNTKQVPNFTLYRSNDGMNFQKVKDIPYTGSQTYTITDKVDVPASERTYTYYIEAPDICQTNFSRSNTVSTMRIYIDANDITKNKLSWNAFDSWNSVSYEIYRYPEGKFAQADLVDEVITTSYIDDVSELLSSTDRTFYYIKAIEQGGAVDNDPKTCISANSFAKKETIFFIPNAFAPKDAIDERNSYFKPACSFVRAGTYSFKIFNRQGTLLFETNDTEEGWNGKYKDEFCPVGVYVYKIEYTDSEGMQQTKSGTFFFYD